MKWYLHLFNRYDTSIHYKWNLGRFLQIQHCLQQSVAGRYILYNMLHIGHLLLQILIEFDASMQLMCFHAQVAKLTCWPSKLSAIVRRLQISKSVV